MSEPAAYPLTDTHDDAWHVDDPLEAVAFIVRQALRAGGILNFDGTVNDAVLRRVVSVIIGAPNPHLSTMQYALDVELRDVYSCMYPRDFEVRS